MSHDNSSMRKALLTSAFVIAVAGSPVLAAPAHSAPGGCEQFAFAGLTTIRAVQDGQIKDLTFTSNEPTFSGPITSPANPRSVNGTANLDPGGHFEMNASQENVLLNVGGDVGPDNKIHGTMTLQDGEKSVSLPANSVGAVKCAKEAPKQGPTVEYSPILGGLNVHVTDRSGTTSQCTYDSDGFTRTFRLEANSATDLKIVPAIPKFDNWNVKITCDNGAVTETTQFF